MPSKKQLCDYIKIYDDALSLQRCGTLIERFESATDYHEAMHIDNAYNYVQLHVKNAWPDVFDELQDRLGFYLNHYQDSLDIRRFWPKWNLLESPRLRRYMPDGRDWFAPHVDTLDQVTSSRFCTAIFYLNEPEGGETIFPDLDVAIRPKTGRLALFPPLWTYVHAALPPRRQPKYTLQTYLNYPPPGADAVADTRTGNHFQKN